MKIHFLLSFLLAIVFTASNAQDDPLKNGLHLAVGIPMNGVALDDSRMGFGVGFEVGNRFYVGPALADRVRFGILTNWVQVSVYGRGNKVDYGSSHLFWEWQFFKSGLIMNTKLTDQSALAVYGGVVPMLISLGVPFDDNPYYYHNHGAPAFGGLMLKWNKFMVGADGTFGTVRVEDHFVGPVYDANGEFSYEGFITKDLAYNRYRVYFGMAF